MWVATTLGFISCTCPKKKDGTRDIESIQLRARLRAHLPRIMGQFPDIFEGFTTAAITEDTGTDYRFRLIVPKTVFVRLMAELAMANNAHNFKNEVAREWGNDDPYTNACHEMWHVGHTIQENERRREAGLGAIAKRGRGR